MPIFPLQHPPSTPFSSGPPRNHLHQQRKIHMASNRTHHAVMVPLPTPGHIDPMLKLAKLLHTHHGFHITFFITHHVHHRLLLTSSMLPQLEGFRLEVVSDGLPFSGRAGERYLRDLTVALETTFVGNVRQRVLELGDHDPDAPKVTCLVSGLLGPAVEVAEEIGVPGVLFWTTSACGFTSTLYMDDLLGRGYLPLKDESFYTNGYLDTLVDWIPGLRPLRLRDTTSFVRTTDPDDVYVHFHIRAAEWASRASAVVLNTFSELEHDALHAMQPKLKRLYTIGPLPALALYANTVVPTNLASLRLNLWKEDKECLKWLDKQEPNSVLYVSFGSISVMEPSQLAEFAWGVAGSGLPFLWVVRPDVVAGEAAAGLPEGFAEETEGRGYVCGWCPQEEVLAHPSVGGFVTHGGWNSMLEGIRRGVPMVCCLSVFADQPTNRRYACEEWGVAVAVEMEEGEVERGRVEGLVREVMRGEVGRGLRERCMEWREKAEKAADLAGKNVEGLVRLLGGEI